MSKIFREPSAGLVACAQGVEPARPGSSPS